MNIQTKTLLLFLVLIVAFPLFSQESVREQWQVSYVVDGDTFYAHSETQGRTKFRLIGIDAPESKHPTKPVQAFSKKT